MGSVGVSSRLCGCVMHDDLTYVHVVCMSSDVSCGCVCCLCTVCSLHQLCSQKDIKLFSFIVREAVDLLKSESVSKLPVSTV